MRITTIFSLCMAIAATVTAQTNPTQQPTPAQTPPVNYSARGHLGISDAQLFDTYLRTIEGVGVSTRDLLAEQSLKSYMMPPRKMGNNAHSQCYALASAIEFYVNLNSNYKDNLSPDFMQLNMPNGSFEDYLAFLTQQGTVSAAILPYQSTVLPPSVQAAVRYKINNYIKLFQTTTRPQQKLYDLRKAITRGNPVIVEMQITHEFKNLKQARVWNVSEGDKTPAGTHYLIVVGYDENRKMVELLNSSGREWGNGGYILMSYDDFGLLAANAYVLLP